MAIKKASTSSINTGYRISKNTPPAEFNPDITQQTYTYSTTQPVGWWIANDLTTVVAGTSWPNRGSGVGGVMVSRGQSTAGGNLISSWRNGNKAIGWANFNCSFNTNILSQNGNLTWMAVAQHNSSNFGPYMGVGEWWGNYSPPSAINAWYYHGLYGSWGGSSASPVVLGGKKSSGSYTFRVFHNGSFSQDTPGAYTDGSEIRIQPGSSSNQAVAEFLVWNQVLTDSEVTTVTNALRSKYSF
jgi:hypothetical protein